MSKLFAVVSLTLAAFAGSAQASIVDQWDFNSTTPDGNVGTGNLSASFGSGTASTVVGTPGGAGTFVTGGGTDSTAADNSAYTITNGFSSNSGSGTRGFQFLGTTAGFWNIGFSWDHRTSATAIRYAQVQYTVDGSTWITANTVDLNSPATLNTFSSFSGTGFGNAAGNNANFGVRVLSVFAPGQSVYNTIGGTNYTSSSSGGTWRVDMATITGTANSAPTGGSSNGSVTAGDAPVTIDLSTLWGDADIAFGDIVSLNGSSGPAEFSLSGNMLTFTAPGSIVGLSQTYTFNYGVIDSVGATGTGFVTFTVTPTPGSAALAAIGVFAASRRRRA